MNKKQIDEIFFRLSEKIPNPKIELDYINPYTLLVAVILSAQSTDKGVNKVTPDLFLLASTPEEMLKLGEEKLKDMVKTIGLYNSKAKNIIKMSQTLVDEHNGEVPDNFEALNNLAGVGRKSANVMLNSIFGQPTIAVDTHVFRLGNRLGLCKTNTPEKTEFALKKVIPDKWKNTAHHLLVLHGRYICKARKANCLECVIVDLCKFKDKVFS